MAEFATKTMTEQKKENKQEESQAPEIQEENKQEEANAPESQEDKNNDSQASGEDDSQEIDYKEELENEKKKHVATEKQLIKAEYVIEGEKKKNKQVKEEDSYDDDDADDDSEDIETKINKKVDEKLEGYQKNMVANVINSTLEKLSSNEDEKELIKFHYNNSLKATGFDSSSIEKDLANARLLANRKTLINENEELKRSLASKGAITNTGFGSSQKTITEGEQPKLSEAERRIFERLNSRRALRGEKSLSALEFKNS